MPALGFGTWQLHDEAAADAVTAALTAGYRLIDTSGSYGNVAEVGAAVGGSSVAREDIFLVTKVESDEDPVESLRRQLGEMKLDRVDLTLIHWPPGVMGSAHEAHPADPHDRAGVHLWQGLIRAREQGMTTDIGVSNYNAELIDVLVDATDEVPAVDQVEWSPFGHSMRFREYLRSREIALQAYSPLAQYHKLDHPVLQKIAQAHGKTPGQVVLRWDFQLGVVPLPRSGSVEHIKENFGIFDFELSDEEMGKITGLNEEFSVIADKHGLGGLIYL
jgi:2,5-diketo-D-gluconate reductase A